MKPILRWSVSILVVAWVFFSLADVSQAKGKPKPAKVPYTGIVSVDTTAMTITVEPKNSTATGTRTYKFSPLTKITVNGQPGTLAGLVPGQQIRIGAGMNPDVAAEIHVTPPPPDPKYVGGGTTK